MSEINELERYLKLSAFYWLCHEHGSRFLNAHLAGRPIDLCKPTKRAVQHTRATSVNSIVPRLARDIVFAGKSANTNISIQQPTSFSLQPDDHFRYLHRPLSTQTIRIYTTKMQFTKNLCLVGFLCAFAAAQLSSSASDSANGAAVMMNSTTTIVSTTTDVKSRISLMTARACAAQSAFVVSDFDGHSGSELMA